MMGSKLMSIPSILTGPRRAVGNMSDHRSRGRDLIPALFHSFTEIDDEIISTAIFFPSTESRRVVVSYM